MSNISRVKILSWDTVFTIVGTFAVVMSVIVSQQWGAERRSQMSELMDEITSNRHALVQVEDVKRESVRLRDLNTLYTMLIDVSGLFDVSRVGKQTGGVFEEAIRAYEIALISMAKHDDEINFDKTVFEIEIAASAARKGDAEALGVMARQFIRFYGSIGKKIAALTKRQQEIDVETRNLRVKITDLGLIATYLQVFGLILVMVAPVISMKRIELRMES